MLKRIFRQFCVKKEIQVSGQGYQVPPFDENLFNQINKNYKSDTGYAFVDFEPFPRLKIAKICYIVLEKLKDTPENSNFRLFNEEYMKYLINKCIEIHDIKLLEHELSTDCIETFIEELSCDIDMIEKSISTYKPWEEPENIDSFDEDESYNLTLKPVLEDKLYPAIEEKPIRINKKFIK